MYGTLNAFKVSSRHFQKSTTKTLKNNVTFVKFAIFFSTILTNK